jgi:hypothetical protein
VRASLHAQSSLRSEAIPRAVQPTPPARLLRRCVPRNVAAKLNDINTPAGLAGTLRRINDQSASHLDELLPWNWKLLQAHAAAA